MKRSTFKKRKAVPTWKRPRRKKLLVPKATGERLDGGKGPWRSKVYLDAVRQEPCLSCGVSGVQAHHLRIGLRTMGVRVSDAKTVPLCPQCHDQLHSGNESHFWAARGVDPILWCVSFLSRFEAARRLKP